MKTDDPFPADAVGLKRAAFLAKMSRPCLLARVASGKLREWRRTGEGERGRFYSEAECRALAPRRVR